MWDKVETKQRIIDFMRNAAYRPLSAEDLADEMALKGTELNHFFTALDELVEAAAVIKTRYDKYGLPDKMNLAVGRLTIHSKGFGFLLPENPEEEDVFIAPDDLLNAMHNDRVVVRLHNKHARADRRREGEVIRIVSRANSRIVGVYESSRHFGFVIPDDKRIRQDIFIPQHETAQAKNGDRVVAEITVWPEKQKSAAGRIIEVLGRPGDKGIEVLALLKRHQLAVEFPEPVEQAAAKVPDKIHPDDLTDRRDLRRLPLVTIDGEDAKDLDDAVFVERLDNGNHRLGVHIADVSYYVREDSSLDREARERGTSVYLVDRVLPMLPPRLSNGICSLNAGADRLAMSCEMEIDRNGKIVDYDIYQSVIHVRDRLTYTTVRKILTEQDPALSEQYRHQLEHIQEMERLCQILRKRRMRRGAIDFDFPEVKVKLDEAGKPVEIIKRVRTIAESIIEEFMLVANETVAEHMFRRKVPFVYRIHEEPASEKMVKLNQLLHNFGQRLGKLEDIRPGTLQKVLTKIAGKPEERIVSSVMLRSLKQARYEAENLGHFGLAARFYTHFTSPIRRYPDLIVHRLLREMLEGGIPAKRRDLLRETLPEIAFHASERERAATEAERESVDLKKVEYMEQFIGQEFSGVINGVTAFGVFVELDNGIEGLVHVSTMDDDYYAYIEEQYMLLGERTRKIYRLGDPVAVVVTKVSHEENTIDFRFTDATLDSRPLAEQRRRHGGTGQEHGRRGPGEERRAAKQRPSARRGSSATNRQQPKKSGGRPQAAGTAARPKQSGRPAAKKR
ncbi:MAG: ribonuclease R [Sporomusaceae bacterium]|nr:ribonuclease R [Sporomusaceae bacterium]